jgi:hypothetical protein
MKKSTDILDEIGYWKYRRMIPNEEDCELD